MNNSLWASGLDVPRQTFPQVSSSTGKWPYRLTSFTAIAGIIFQTATFVRAVRKIFHARPTV